jgi:hypothetical protein
MITETDLETARRQIAERFVDQCSRGPQVKTLSADIKACGQYLGEATWPQRGVHGTAGVIRVLAEDGQPEARNLLPQLVRYLEHRKANEEQVPSFDRAWLANQLTRDNANVIKISETLFGLDFVPTAVYPTEAFRNELASRLMTGAVNSRGWGYFLDRRGEPQLLPTAHAVRALARHGYPVDHPVDFMLKALKSPNGATKGISRADISVQVFCLFVLCFTKTERPLVAREQLKDLFVPLWHRLESLLSDDIEQNIEYSRNGDSYYVRVPWQLYLIALSCCLAPMRAFASQAVQGRLRFIVKVVGSRDGFVYPHSGGQASSRTNAILYDVFSETLHQLKSASPLLRVAHWADKVRKALNSRIAALVGYVLAVSLMVVSTVAWYLRRGTLEDLAPNFVAWFVLLLLTARKTR